jgi:hypothetical protein
LRRNAGEGAAGLSNRKPERWKAREEAEGGLTARLKRGILAAMSAREIIEQIKALPAKERAQVAKFVVENDDSWIPESFQQGMADAEAGRLVDLDI